ncbi:MAG: hypothetical protein FJ098_14235, partial [Deltaproteobacteria bacterium]|nr:hypothetical protein [Deltaproteobacteria bacterium]
VEGDCQYGAVAGCCNIDGDCDDGLDTTLDACEDNACTHEPVPIPCSGDGECDDGDVCTFDGCVDGICQNTPSADPFCCNDVDDCDDGDDSTVDHCIDSQCSWTNCVSDIDCEDNNPCSGQSCQAGVCVFTVVESADCACITNADCVGKGGACSLVNTGPTSVATYCVNVAGPKMGGVECEENGDCYTGLCMGLSSGEDLCFQGCEADNECAPGMMCATIVWGMGTANEKEIPACLPAPAFCTGDGSCPEGEICRPTENPNQPDTILLVCAAPASGTKTAGAVCAADADCQSNICVQVIGKGQSICWSPCVATTDCAPGLTCYPNLLYFLFDQETEGTADDVQYSVGSCMPNLGSYAPCQGDTGCPAGEFCYPGNNQTATALEPRCLKSWGGSNPAGQTCNTDGQCLSSACISAPNGFCLGLCTSSAGCYGGTTCQNYPTFVVDDKGTPDDDTDDVLDDVDLCLP